MENFLLILRILFGQRAVVLASPKREISALKANLFFKFVKLSMRSDAVGITLDSFGRHTNLFHLFI